MTAKSSFTRRDSLPSGCGFARGRKSLEVSARRRRNSSEGYPQRRVGFRAQGEYESHCEEDCTKKAGFYAREKQDEAVMRRRAPDPRIPEHLQERIVARHGGLVRKPNQRSCHGCQHKPVLAYLATAVR